MNKGVIVVRGSITSSDALCMVASLTGDRNVMLESAIIYPYYSFDAQCSVPTLAGRKELSLLCLVDAINGLGATADRFEQVTESVCAESMLPTEVTGNEAADIAHRTVTHHLGRKLRMIASFDAAIMPRGIVHKRFWIVHSSDTRIMVDSTTGNLHPLKLKVA